MPAPPTSTIDPPRTISPDRRPRDHLPARTLDEHNVLSHEQLQAPFVTSAHTRARAADPIPAPLTQPARPSVADGRRCCARTAPAAQTGTLPRLRAQIAHSAASHRGPENSIDPTRDPRPEPDAETGRRQPRRQSAPRAPGTPQRSGAPTRNPTTSNPQAGATS